MTQLISNSYTKDYRDYCFFTWYGNGRPKFTDLEIQIEKFQDRMKPSVHTLSKWASDDNWMERAEALDEKVMEQIQDALVSEKAKMFSRHAGIGRKLIDLGVEYFETNPISSQSAALRAIQLGVEVEAEAAQVEKLFKSVAEMEDSKVSRRLRKILDRTRFKTAEEAGESDN